MAAQVSGTSASIQRAIDGQSNVSLPGTVAASAAQIGQPFAIPGDAAGRDITWELVITGTAPSTLEVDVEGSLDQGFTVATANPGAATGAQLDTYTGVVSTMRHITNKQIPFVRMNIIAMTGGDSTTRIMGRFTLAKRGAAN